jgi:uncharacterized protein YcsI (UPF0317 family)
MASGADLRKDLPLYNVYRDGVLSESLRDVEALWQDDFVAFLIGCSFSFEEALIAVRGWARRTATCSDVDGHVCTRLLQAGLPVRHVDEKRNVPMYATNMATTPSGPFRGPMVVSMRPMTPKQAKQASAITSRFPRVHGGCVCVRWFADKVLRCFFSRR